MSAFTAVNSAREMDDHALGRIQEPTTPTTPRPRDMVIIGDDPHMARLDESSSNTPTRDSFGAVSGQRSLAESSSNKRPTEDMPLADHLGVASSHRSRDPPDVDMAESDEEAIGSENDDDGGEAGRPSKKKKGQRFFCTEFPPCKLSFTRSEHLARHIRKHTGERPFQCHCARRFSRLDNLRQHAQTVHVNEEIPTNSLAATGTRFQRQVRTDRVRPGGNRSRASTMGSQSSHGRGHSRNPSSSSIGSTTSSVNYRDDARRRPASMVAANPHSSQPSLSLDTYRSPPDSPGGQEAYQRYSAPSPGGYSTPTSATYSTGPGSPRFPSGFRSPTSGVAQAGAFWDGRSPTSRRLSVPSGVNPFQSHPGHTYSQPYFSPLASSNASTFSGRSSAFGSPTSSVFSPGREYGSQTAPNRELKRRTWHPESRPTVNSPLANSSIAYVPSTIRRPTLSQTNTVAFGTRLPGIESFDHFSARTSTPPRRNPSPMQMDTPDRPPIFPGPVENSTAGPDNRRSVAEWDMSLHKNLNKLGINSSTTPTAEARMAWPGPMEAGLSSNAPHPSHARQISHPSHSYSNRHPRPMPGHAALPTSLEQPVDAVVHRGDEASVGVDGAVVNQASMERSRMRPTDSVQSVPETPRKNKRQGWYNGPLSAQRNAITRRSPEDSSSSEGVATPSTSSVGEMNPSIRHSNGWLESNPSTPPAENAKASSYPTGGSSQSEAYPLSGGNDNGPAPGLPPGDHVLRSVPVPTQQGTPRRENNMLRLDALVAVATSEEK